MDRQPRSIDQLVEEQIRRWMVSQTRQVPGTTMNHARVSRHRVITVSREYGAQGERLARYVAERMAYTCWDQELVHAIARDTNAPTRLLESLDEHRRSAIEALADVFRPAAEIGNAQYVSALIRVVHAVAAQEKAVIVGRGSQFILGRDEALHVRVIAPLEVRVRGLATRRGWSEAEARAAVARHDEDRKAFLRATFGRDPSDPLHYDLVLNVAALPLEHAAEIVEVAWQAKFHPMAETAP